MPLYTYNCDSCGGFRDWQSITASDQSAPCPRCGTASQRAVTAPTILRMDPRKRNAHMRNEKSAHEPQVVRREKREPQGAHRHAHGHAHGGAHGLGAHLHTSSRPWMIGH